MVYRKGTLKVLLGPEHLQGDEYFDEGDTSPDTTVVQIKPQPRKTIEPFHGYGKIGESKVYKRTRPLQTATQQRPRLDRYPSGLELSGQSVEKGDTKSATSVRSTLSTASALRNREQDTQPDAATKPEDTDSKSQMGKESDPNKQADNGQKPSLQKSRTAARLSASMYNVSNNFLTDFGLRSERTDTFSGHHRRRGVASAEIERQMGEKAEKHIRTCQLMGNVKRSSKAQLGYQGLKLAVSPRHSTGSFYSPDPKQSSLTPRELYRSEENLNKSNTVSYMIQIRKNLGSISKTRAIGQSYKRPDPLPAITCRTMMVGSGLGVQ